MFLIGKTFPFVGGPFEQAQETADAFAFNMLYAGALEKSLRLIDIAQQQYERAIEEDDDEMIAIKRKELDYCLKCLRFSSLAAAANVDEPSP
jgi:hypothetical protein|tara:strand:+ start:35 stop:310 length:276 start_codon:yes stop_codon:yes gene_type:complete